MAVTQSKLVCAANISVNTCKRFPQHVYKSTIFCTNIPMDF